MAIWWHPASSPQSRSFFISGTSVLKERISISGQVPSSPFARQATMMSRRTSNPMAQVKISCIALPPVNDAGWELPGWVSELCYSCSSPFGDATYCCSLGQFVHVEKRGVYPPRCNRTSPATLSVPDSTPPRTCLIFIPSCVGLENQISEGIDTFLTVPLDERGKRQRRVRQDHL